MRRDRDRRFTPRRRRLNAWQPLADGRDIAIAPGYAYALIASVSKSYAKADILAKVPAGVLLIDYAEQGERAGLGPDPNTDHRYIAVQFASQSYTGTLPWKSPWPTTIFSLVQAWVAPLSGQNIAPTSSTASSPWPWVVGVLSLAGATFGAWWWKTRHG
jgi:hypothetical protein